MSALVDLPAKWREFAMGAGATDVDAMWKACFEWHQKFGKDITQTNWEKWVERERTKIEVPKAEAQKPVIRYPEYKPPDWGEKSTPIESLAAAKNILDVLNALGGKPVHAEAPKPQTPIDPVCSKCGRICETGRTQHERCTAAPAVKQPETLGDVLEDFQTEEPHGSDEEDRDYEPGPEPEGFFDEPR